MRNVLCFTVIVLAFNVSVFGQNWITNFNKAKEEASKTHHDIVLVFQGSDWCGPCIRLNKEIWSSPEFESLAKDHFVMLKADFPRRKENKLSEEQASQNAKLAETYNQQGFFPLVVVLTPDGKVLGKMGYEKLSPKSYFNKLMSFDSSL